MDRDERHPMPGQGGIVTLPPYQAVPGARAGLEPWPLPHAPVPSGAGAHLGESAAQDDASLRTPQDKPQRVPPMTPTQRHPAEPFSELLLLSGQNIDQLRQAIDTEDVAGVDLVLIGTDGATELDYGLTVKSVAVVNYTGSTITVAGQSGRQTQTPLAGAQVFLVGAAAFQQVPLITRSLVVYGNPGGSVLVVRYASVKPVAGGLIGTPPPQSLMRTVTPGNPAAGADFSVTVAALQTWRVRTVAATFTTSATVANRTPVLQIVDPGGNIAYTIPLFNGPMPASTVDNISAYPGAALSYGGTGPFTTVVPIPDLVLPTGWTIRSVTGNIQAGDQWSAIVLSVEVADLTKPSPYL